MNKRLNDEDKEGNMNKGSDKVSPEQDDTKQALGIPEGYPTVDELEPSDDLDKIIADYANKN